MPIDAKQPYDDQNIFAKILRGEIPNKTVMETDHSLAFHDINPLGRDPCAGDPQGSLCQLGRFHRQGVRRGNQRLRPDRRRGGADDRRRHPRLSDPANSGKRGGQEVPHLHIHVFGGQPLGPMLAR